MLPTTYCGCEAGRAAEREAIEAAVQQERAARRRAAGVPARFQDQSLATHPDQAAAARATRWVDRYVADRAAPNLLIAGAVGQGKTGLAVAVVDQLLDRSRRVDVRFWGAPAVLDAMRPGSDRDPMPDLLRADVLVLDDLGAEKGTDWVRERMYVLFNSRYEAMRPTIVTTNLSLRELALQLTQRTMSRLTEDMQTIPVGKGTR